MLDPVVARVDGTPLVDLDTLIWIGGIARRGAQQVPLRAAIIFAERGEQISYLELDRRSDAFAALLQARGLRSGDRIAYLGRNSDLFFPVLFGAIRANVVLVPINWRLASPEIAYQLKDSEAALLICDPDLLAAANIALQGLESPPALLPTEGDDGGQNLRSLLSQPAPAVSLPQISQLPDQVILQLYTSGTTGNPKGVLISHYALSLARHAELISPDFALLAEGQITLSAMPNFHVGGMSWVLMGLVRLGTVVLTADPSPGNMLNLIREYGIDHSFIVPSVVRAIVDDLKLRELPAPQMKGIFYGAMTMGESLLRESMSLFGCSFGQFFGMTENTGSVTYLAPRDHDPARPHLLGSVGKPYPGMSLEIRDTGGRLLNAGEHGEIWIKSPTRLVGYWKLPEKSREAVVDGWYATGDGGYLDPDGYLYLTDRIKDMIVSGGENIYPAEVEEILRTHPAVSDVACIGVPDAHWGEIVAVVVELRPGQAATEDELRTFARARIAGFKCPKRVHFAAALPRTASGKVKRAELRTALRNSPGVPSS